MTARRALLWLFLGLVIAGCQRDPTGPSVVLLEADPFGCSTPSSAVQDEEGGWNVELRFTLEGREGCRIETCQFDNLNFPIVKNAIAQCVEILGFAWGGE